VGELVSFVTKLHTSTSRDYIERVTSHEKGACAEVAKKYGKDYWDGERQYGYGGYSYDGRWEAVARNLISHYKLQDGASILDIGAGKGYLLYELKKLLPNANVQGVDISSYAVQHAKEEIKDSLQVCSAAELPFSDNAFDLIISNTTLHNLKIFDLTSAIQEIARVMKDKGWICVESYRNETEKANLLYWQLTCESFYSPEEWCWLYAQNGYTGDFEFIYFE
jgi:protein-L-isoaspartate(D-aspartate) O-methyltransferase